MRYLILLAVLAPMIAGAFDLRPTAVDAEFDHISHASQHFGVDQTNYGAEIAALVARWQLGPRVSVSLSEGFTFGPRWQSAGDFGYGAILGPREVFQGRIAVNLWHR